MGKRVHIVGAGGHTRSLVNLLSKNKYLICGIYDNNYDEYNEETIMSSKLIGKISNIRIDDLLILSFGDNSIRKKYFYQYKDQLVIENLIHHKTHIESNFKTGISNQFFANAYINSNVIIGDNNIINSGAIVEHEVEIKSHNHISVGSIICGRVKIGNNCFIGAGSTIIDKISICDNVIIGANSVVIKDIDIPGTYVGNPVRRIK